MEASPKALDQGDSLPNPEDILACVRNLRREMELLQASGERWVVADAASLGFKEEILTKPGAGKKLETAKPASRLQDPLLKIPLPTPQPSMPPVRTASVPEKKPAGTAAKPAVPQEMKPQSAEGINPGGIALVRLCPSETELKNGMPWSDEGGKMVLEVLSEAGAKNEGIYKGYFCRFHLEYLSEDSSEIAKWKNNFFKEMEELKPALIACFGERVAQILSGEQKPIDEIRKTGPKILSGLKIGYFYDPRFILKKKPLRNSLLQELKSFLEETNFCK